MNTIPSEYNNADFGFSAVDEVDFKATQSTEQPTSQHIDENDLTRVVLSAIAPLEDKLDRLLQRRQIEESDDVQLAIIQTQHEVNLKVAQLEKIIMPLLVNLLNTADKEYLHWPNRASQVQAQIDKVLAITRG